MAGWVLCPVLTSICFQTRFFVHFYKVLGVSFRREGSTRACQIACKVGHVFVEDS